MKTGKEKRSSYGKHKKCYINITQLKKKQKIKSMTEKEDKFQTLLICCLEEMKLPKENIIAILTMLQTEKQMGTMLDWIKKHYKENPSEDIIIQIAETIKKQVK